MCEVLAGRKEVHLGSLNIDIVFKCLGREVLLVKPVRASEQTYMLPQLERRLTARGTTAACACSLSRSLRLPAFGPCRRLT
jgi:xanthine/CO dehydrogenase XdhC/CoxF family maturation factor